MPYSLLGRRTPGVVLDLLNRFSPRAAKVVARRLFFTPKRKWPTSSERRLLKTGTPFTQNLKGKLFPGWRFGEGPTLVFAHGWSSLGCHFESFVPKALSQGYSVVLYDSPGNGQADGVETNYFEQTEALRQVLRSESQVVGIVGHSFGGAAVMGCLSKEDLSIPAVLIAPVLEMKAILRHFFSTHGVSTVIWHSLIKDLENNWGYDLSEDDPYMLLSTVKADILIIHDTDDETVPYAITKRQVEKHPKVRLMTTSGLGHKGLLNDNTVIDTVLNHLSQR